MLHALQIKMSEASKRGKSLGLTEDEVAFYDALAANESAVKAMGNAELKVIAAELVTRVRASVRIPIEEHMRDTHNEERDECRCKPAMRNAHAVPTMRNARRTAIQR